MPRQIRHSSIRCRADEYGATWFNMSDDTEVLAYSHEEALEAWRSDKADRQAERHSVRQSDELLF
jgi:hypothetical protein